MSIRYERHAVMHCDSCGTEYITNIATGKEVRGLYCGDEPHQWRTDGAGRDTCPWCVKAAEQAACEHTWTGLGRLRWCTACDLWQRRADIKTDDWVALHEPRRVEEVQLP